MPESTIDRLQIEIEAESKNATSSLDRFISSIERLRNLTANVSPGLERISQSLLTLGNSLSSIKGKTSSVTSLANSLAKLQGINLNTVNQNLSGLVKSTEQFSGVGSSLQSVKNFSRGITTLRSSFERINKIDLDTTAANVKKLASAIRPLTDEMIRGGPAVLSYGQSLSQLASAMRTINNTGKLTYQMTKSTENLNSTLNRTKGIATAVAAFYTLREIGQYVSGFIGSINSYVEDVNLFTVAMGDAAEEAEIFTQKMQDVLGIDAGEAMRNMGVFNQFATSFGVSAEQAEILSRKFTQLGYDLASFFNLSTEDAFEKLQSGLAGK